MSLKRRKLKNFLKLQIQKSCVANYSCLCILVVFLNKVEFSSSYAQSEAEMVQNQLRQSLKQVGSIHFHQPEILLLECKPLRGAMGVNIAANSPSCSIKVQQWVSLLRRPNLACNPVGAGVW